MILSLRRRAYHLWLSAACATAALAGTAPALGAQCAGGYALVVRAAGGQALDSAFLTSLARSVAFRWEVPSKRRSEFAGLRRLRTRTLPPEPRWADDWTPGDAHRATARLTLHRSGKVRVSDPIPRPVTRSSIAPCGPSRRPRYRALLRSRRSRANSLAIPW